MHEMLNSFLAADCMIDTSSILGVVIQMQSHLLCSQSCIALGLPMGGAGHSSEGAAVGLRGPSRSSSDVALTSHNQESPV